MRVGVKLNYPWVCGTSAIKHFVVNILRSSISSHKQISVLFNSRKALDGFRLPHQRDDYKKRKQLSPVAEQHPDTAPSVSKVSRTHCAPEFCAKPIFSRYLLHLPPSPRCWLVWKYCQFKEDKVQTYLPLSASPPQPGTRHNHGAFPPHSSSSARFYSV